MGDSVNRSGLWVKRWCDFGGDGIDAREGQSCGDLRENWKGQEKINYEEGEGQGMRVRWCVDKILPDKISQTRFHSQKNSPGKIHRMKQN